MNFQAIYTEDISTDGLQKAGLLIKAGSRSTRQPVHMILLCDTSGSMDIENKLSSVKRSVNLLLSLLGSDDRLSVVTFADSSKIVMSRATPSATERQAIQYRIDSLTADGSTNLSAALLDIRNLVEADSSGRKQGVIVLTDGHANVGVVKEDGLIDIVNRIQTETPGLSITCVGYGVDHNNQLLTNLAKKGGGAYNVVKDLEDVATVFGDILGGLVSISAQGVQVQFPPGAEVDTSYRCEKDDAGMTTVYIGDVYADSETTILFRSNSSKGPLRIKGTDMATLDRIDTVVEPDAYSATSPLLNVFRITELRQRTADLLKKASQAQGTTMVPLIESLIATIQSDEAIRDHPLKPFLLDDLEEAKNVATKKVPYDLHTVTQMAQHSAFLGMAKGLRSNTRPVRQVAVGQTPSQFLSPFANQAQTQYATVMRTASNRAEDEENNDEYS